MARAIASTAVKSTLILPHQRQRYPVRRVRDEFDAKHVRERRENGVLNELLGVLSTAVKPHANRLVVGTFQMHFLAMPTKHVPRFVEGLTDAFCQVHRMQSMQQQQATDQVVL